MKGDWKSGSSKWSRRRLGTEKNSISMSSKLSCAVVHAEIFRTSRSDSVRYPSDTDPASDADACVASSQSGDEDLVRYLSCLRRILRFDRYVLSANAMSPALNAMDTPALVAANVVNVLIDAFCAWA